MSRNFQEEWNGTEHGVPVPVPVPVPESRCSHYCIWLAFNLNVCRTFWHYAWHTLCPSLSEELLPTLSPHGMCVSWRLKIVNSWHKVATELGGAVPDKWQQMLACSANWLFTLLAIKHITICLQKQGICTGVITLAVQFILGSLPHKEGGFLMIFPARNSSGKSHVNSPCIFVNTTFNLGSLIKPIDRSG